MSEKRKDSKGRILRNGESQRSDGRYCYTYQENGMRKFLYSWKLEKTDPLPKGKKDGKALREQIKEYKKALLNEVKFSEGSMSVYELVERYTQTKTGVKYTTKAGYKTVLNILAQEDFAKKSIKDVKTTDAKLWLIKMQTKDGRGYSSIHTIRGVVRPAFQTAVDDDLIVKNPFDFELATVCVDDSVTREALTREEERKFLKFVQEDRHYSKYYDGIFVLFKTGMRIGEFCGLTINDIDLDNKRINIHKQLQRQQDGTKYIETTKTGSGTRIIPITNEVNEAFKRIIIHRPKIAKEPEIDGVEGFLFLDKDGQPMVPMHWQHYFDRIVAKYNRIYKSPMPKVTPHVCRHTYCSNQAKSGMNPKTLQYMMGHSEIGVTLNTYTHIRLEDAQAEVNLLELGGKKIKAL